jgi:hypothetical protein
VVVVTIRGDLVPPAQLERLLRPAGVCTCTPKWFPRMLDADCPQHGLRALIEGRFNIDEYLDT